MKDLKVSKLNDVYGELLTERQRIMAKEYFDLDLSLAEIAENYHVTRQAVHSALCSAERALYLFEEKIGYLKLSESCRAVADDLEDMADGRISPEAIKALAEKLRS